METKCVLLISICIAALTSGVLSQTKPCRNGWYYFNGNCYGLGQERMSWPEAEQFCILYEGSLAEVSTSAEADFLKQILNNASVPRTIYGAWIGGTDIFTEGTWEWAGSKRLINEFDDWYPGEPNHIGNDGSEDCLSMWKVYNWRWNDEDCHTKEMHFICQTGSSAPNDIIG